MYFRGCEGVNGSGINAETWGTTPSPFRFQMFVEELVVKASMHSCTSFFVVGECHASHHP